jgi:transcriptional regulator with XRE-family HTH domain
LTIAIASPIRRRLTYALRPHLRATRGLPASRGAWMMAGRPLKAVDPDASAAARVDTDLRVLRVERELTLSKLGDKIGFSAQYISGAELARTTVSARFVAACDRVLGVDGALVALLPDMVWEKELRRRERSSARDPLAPSPRPASGPPRRRRPPEPNRSPRRGGRGCRRCTGTRHSRRTRRGPRHRSSAARALDEPVGDPRRTRRRLRPARAPRYRAPTAAGDR